MAKFLKNFKEKNMTNGFLPNSIIESLNAKWNGNLSYKYVDDEGYLLLPNLSKINLRLENLKLKNKEEIEEKCGIHNMTINNFLDYSYNAQEPLHFELSENQNIYINDQLIKQNEVGIFPEGKLKLVNGAIIIFPSEMNNNFDLNVGTKDYSYKFTFEQKPIEHFKKKKFSTKNDSWIHIEFELFEEKITFNFKVDISNISTVKEYLEGLKFIQNLYINGMYINGKLLCGPFKDDKDQKRDELIDLWKKVLEIESKLGLNFKLTHDEFSKQELIDIFTLYQTLILKKPIKENDNIKNIKYEFNNTNEKLFNEFDSNHYKNLYFEESDEIIINILSNKIKVYRVKGYFNLNVSKIRKDNKEQKYVLYFKEDETYKMFQSVMLFQSNKEMNDFLKNKEHIEFLYNNSSKLSN